MYILDTHVWFWVVEAPEKIPAKVKHLLEKKQNIPWGLSAMSVWEVAKLVELERIKLSIPIERWVENALDSRFMELLPLTPEIAIASTRLPGKFHSDPADQIIVATARLHDSTLITADKRIRHYEGVKAIWE